MGMPVQLVAPSSGHTAMCSGPTLGSATHTLSACPVHSRNPCLAPKAWAQKVSDAIILDYVFRTEALTVAPVDSLDRPRPISVSSGTALDQGDR